MYYCHQTTTSHFVVEDAIFGRMDDIGDMFTKEVHEEFISKCLCKAPGNLLPEYSYIYVLVAHGPSRSTEPGAKRWSDILSCEQSAFLERHNALVIAWMLMTPEHPKDVHFIEYVDSRVPGYHLVDCMIRKFENELAIIEDHADREGCIRIKPKCVLPKEVLATSAGYWVKYLKSRLDIHTRAHLDSLVMQLRLDSIVRWCPLETAYDTN